MLAPIPCLGDPVPWFTACSSVSSDFAFHSVAGRYVVLCFLGAATSVLADGFQEAVRRHRALFDGTSVCLFCVSTDPEDQQPGRLPDSGPGIIHLWDVDQAVSRSYGAQQAGSVPYVPFWLVLDPMLRVLHAAPLSEAEAVLALVAALPPCRRHAGGEVPPPVLIIPRVFETAFCQHLIRLYEANGGQESGVMRQEGNYTVLANHPEFKRRRDYTILDERTKAALHRRIERRLAPEIRKAFQFQPTRIERFIVACYDAADAAHFKPHRDNTTKGTAHRRFAVTINLNHDFEGGDLRFPEFGSRTYRAPVGGAIVFSCSLLHQVTRVTRGIRYATLPFLHDEAAEEIRLQNDQFLQPDTTLQPEAESAA
jgi:predicted 2-oxoglutarate/Fe(II)-dependent dioxygenase YbiX/peroxiredoxin